MIKSKKDIYIIYKKPAEKIYCVDFLGEKILRLRVFSDWVMEDTLDYIDVSERRILKEYTAEIFGTAFSVPCSAVETANIELIKINGKIAIIKYYHCPYSCAYSSSCPVISFMKRIPCIDPEKAFEEFSVNPTQEERKIDTLKYKIAKFFEEVNKYAKYNSVVKIFYEITDKTVIFKTNIYIYREKNYIEIPKDFFEKTKTSPDKIINYYSKKYQYGEGLGG